MKLWTSIDSRGRGAFVERRDLGAVELHHFGAYAGVVEVEDTQLVADFDERLDAYVVVAVELGVAGKCLQLGPGVGEVESFRSASATR